MARSCFALALIALTLAPGCNADTRASRAPRPEGTVTVLRPEGDGGTIVRDGGRELDAPAAPSVEITAPAAGSSFVRDTIDAAEWVAAVDFQVTAQGVATVELAAAGTSLGTTDAAGHLTYAFHADGTFQVDAIGRDAAGVERARDSVSITITPPADTGCHAMLDALGLDWEVTGAQRGIADPVRVQPLIGGVTYRYTTSTTASAMLMDCSLAPRLVQLSALVRQYDVVEIEHIGIYNYRCIGGGNPDTDGCTPSMHAQARAIDLHAFITSDGTRYDVTDDFVITMRHDSCPMAFSSEPDRILKEIACAMVEDRIFQIVLTPNYNADHRDHFHVDMTEGSMYLGSGAWGVDPGIDGLGE
ncbi:MAG: extensin family protein [Sandaracinus sp.]